MFRFFRFRDFDLALSFVRDFSVRDSDVDNTSEELDGGLTVALFVFSGSETGSIRLELWGRGDCELVDIWIFCVQELRYTHECSFLF